MKKFRPFANEADALTIGGFTVENGTEKVSLYGSLDITRDEAGLQQAKALKSVLDALVRELKAGKDTSSSDSPAPPAKSRQVKNPFA